MAEDMTMKGLYVSYLRVSTKYQGAGGLGISAQRKAITDYLNGGRWELLREFVEVESGKRSDNRPMLQQAFDECMRTGACLLIARLDRLSRNSAFIHNLLESKTRFVACDMPNVNDMTIRVFAVMAQEFRESISLRTKEALQAAKARGVTLGSPKGIAKEVSLKGAARSLEARQKKAQEFAERVYPIIREHRDAGLSLKAISKRLSERKQLTPRGTTKWTPTLVKRVIERVET
jgi:DNA invertase Pin-like site-specific DNA recombinase